MINKTRKVADKANKVASADKEKVREAEEHGSMTSKGKRSVMLKKKKGPWQEEDKMVVDMPSKTMADLFRTWLLCVTGHLLIYVLTITDKTAPCVDPSEVGRGEAKNMTQSRLLPTKTKSWMARIS